MDPMDRWMDRWMDAAPPSPPPPPPRRHSFAPYSSQTHVQDIQRHGRVGRDLGDRGNHCQDTLLVPHRPGAAGSVGVGNPGKTKVGWWVGGSWLSYRKVIDPLVSMHTYHRRVEAEKAFQDDRRLAETLKETPVYNCVAAKVRSLPHECVLLLSYRVHPPTHPPTHHP